MEDDVGPVEHTLPDCALRYVPGYVLDLHFAANGRKLRPGTRQPDHVAVGVGESADQI
jgi:hypothetical protein